MPGKNSAWQRFDEVEHSKISIVNLVEEFLFEMDIPVD
jgi:hypothetical protein